MTKYLFSRCSRSMSLSGVLAVLFAGLAASPALAGTTPVDTSACSDPQLSQPFLSFRDRSWYTLAPGESVDNFGGNGWTLSGGAQVITTQRADGQTGSVLDLPSGSKAVSPAMCVSSDYPTARALVRNVVGGEGVQFYVSYAGTNTAAKPKNTGQVHGQQNRWTLSGAVNVQPGKTPGWQLVQFTLIPGGINSEFQIDNLWVDPRMHS
jgi:hypothetical protein